MPWWKLLRWSGAAVLGLLVLSGTATAQMYGSDIDRRLDRQEEWLQRGIRSGALTPQEAHKLAKEQQRLAREADRIRADGWVTPQERFRLHHKLDQADRRFYRELHDRQVAYPRYGAPGPHPLGPAWHDKKWRRPHGSDRHYRPLPRAHNHWQQYKNWPPAHVRSYKHRPPTPWPWQRDRRLAGQYW